MADPTPTTAAQSAAAPDFGPGVVLVCTACQAAWEPEEVDWASGNTGCRYCGGWTWIGQLAQPATRRVSDPPGPGAGGGERP